VVGYRPLFKKDTRKLVVLIVHCWLLAAGNKTENLTESAGSVAAMVSIENISALLLVLLFPGIRKLLFA